MRKKMEKLVQQNESIGTLISHNTKIVGDLNVTGNIKIEGSIKGNINVSGELILISTGVIEGQIHADTAIIAGEIIGNLITEKKTTMTSQSVLSGDLKTKSLIIEDGAQIKGKCEMKER